MVNKEKMIAFRTQLIRAYPNVYWRMTEYGFEGPDGISVNLWDGWWSAEVGNRSNVGTTPVEALKGLL